MRKLNDFLQSKHPSGLVDKAFINSVGIADPNDIISNPWGGDTLRFMLDPVSGNDSNDGKSWAKAKKTLASAVALIPKNLGELEVFILCMSGNAGGATISINNSAGIIVTKIMSDVIDTFYTNNETITFNDDPIVIGDLTINHSTYIGFRSESANGQAYGGVEITTSGYFGILTQHLAQVEFYGCKLTNSGSYLMFSNGFRTTIGSCSLQGDFIVGEGASILALNADMPIDSNYPKPFLTRNRITGNVKITSFMPVNPQLSIDISQITESSGAFTIDGDKIPIVGVKSDLTGVLVGTDISLTLGTQAMFRNLPTSNPLISGALWSNSGIVTVSAG